jgi:hypothetical protein
MSTTSKSITDTMLHQMEHIRESGFANMFIRTEVHSIAGAMRFQELTDYLDGIAAGRHSDRAEGYGALMQAFSDWKRAQVEGGK